MSNSKSTIFGTDFKDLKFKDKDLKIGSRGQGLSLIKKHWAIVGYSVLIDIIIF